MSPINPFILIFGVKRSNVNVTRQKNIAGVGYGTSVCVGFFYTL